MDGPAIDGPAPRREAVRLARDQADDGRPAAARDDEQVNRRAAAAAGVAELAVPRAELSLNRLGYLLDVGVTGGGDSGSALRREPAARLRRPRSQQREHAAGGDLAVGGEAGGFEEVRQPPPVNRAQKALRHRIADVAVMGERADGAATAVTRTVGLEPAREVFPD